MLCALLSLFLLQLHGETSFITDTNNNPFGDFRLGAGFDMTTYRPLGTHIFREDTESLKYDIMPITNTQTRCVTVNSAKEMSDKLGVSGSLSIKYNMITGKGSMKFDQKEEKMRRKSYYQCTVDRTLFTISVNPPHITKTMSEEERYAALPEDLVDPELTEDDRRELIGDYHVRSITYGRRYKTEIAFTYTNDDTLQKIGGKLEAKIGIGALSVAASVSLEMEKSEIDSDLTIEVGSQSYGFIEAKTLVMPTTSDKDAASSMQDSIEKNLIKFNNLDNFTVHAKTNLSKQALFDLIGDAYPLSYTVEKNARYFPPLRKLTTKEEAQMIRNIDEAYDILRELTDIYESINIRAEALFDNYHLLSGDSTLSIDFLNIRRSFTEKVMDLQAEVNDWLAQKPFRMAEKNVYVWSRELEPPREIEPLSLDFLHAELWDLLGMEDARMNTDDRAIGATCLFNGIQATVAGRKKKFAGRVIFSEEIVRHVIFDDDQEIISLGFIDHTQDIADKKWRGKEHELVYVRDDCTLLRNGSTVWYAESRYTISKIGSDAHLTKEGRVIKEELTNIRIHLQPQDTSREIEVILTDQEIRDVTLRGVQHSYDLTVDTENRLMFSNGYICDDGFSAFEAKAVCTHLGYSRLSSYKTRQTIPTSNAWRRPFISLHNMTCPKWAMKLDQCTYSTNKEEIDWEKCGQKNGVQILCTDNSINAKDVSVEITSSTSAGCTFDANDVNMPMNTASVCFGGEDDKADSFGDIGEINVDGDVCIRLSKSGTLQCVVPEGNYVDLQTEGTGRDNLMSFCYDDFEPAVFPDHVYIMWEVSNRERATCEDKKELLSKMHTVTTCDAGERLGFCSGDTAAPTFAPTQSTPVNGTTTSAPVANRRTSHLSTEDYAIFLEACAKTCGDCAVEPEQYYSISVGVDGSLLRDDEDTPSAIDVLVELEIDGNTFKYNFDASNEDQKFEFPAEAHCANEFSITLRPDDQYSHGDVFCWIPTGRTSVRLETDPQNRMKFTGFVNGDVALSFVCRYPPSYAPSMSPSNSPSCSPSYNPSMSPSSSSPSTSNSPSHSPSDSPSFSSPTSSPLPSFPTTSPTIVTFELQQGNLEVCPSGLRILTLQECHNYAASVNKPLPFNRITQSSRFPMGCLVSTPSGQMWYNTPIIGTANANAQLVCILIE